MSPKKKSRVTQKSSRAPKAASKASPKATTPKSEEAPLPTRAEASGYQETSRHEDVVAFCDALAARSPLVRRTSIGTSGEGRDLVALVLSDEEAFTPEEAKKQGKIVVMVEANIHAGEVEGKEMVLAVARDLVFTSLGKGILSKAVLVLVPDFNPDGNDRISPDNRKLNLAHLEGQENPPGGVGTRYTGQGWNLNRDSTKQEAPETQAMARAYQAWWPHLFIDCHTTDGSLHGFDLTYDTSRGNDLLFKDVRTYTHDFLANVASEVEKRHGITSAWYGNFVREDEPESGWHTYPALPRFGSHYRGLLGRADVLLETYSYLPFEKRCEAMRAWLLELFREAASSASELQEACEATEAAILERGQKLTDLWEWVAIHHGVAQRDEAGALSYTYPSHAYDDETIEIRSFDTASLKERQYPGKKKVKYEVPHLRWPLPTALVTTPPAYLAPAALAERLTGHGISYETLAEPATLEVESYVVLAKDSTFSPDVSALVPEPGQAELPLSQKPPPQRFETVVTVRPERRTVTFPAGTLRVPTAQRAGTLAVYLLEPHSDDGFTRWQFLDGLLEVGGLHPIHRQLVIPRPRTTAE